MHSTLTLSPMPENKPIREIAYETLKHAIITGDIPAGERIVETEYAGKLHISRTPLREALRKLERDGLVEYVIRRGVVVRAFTLEDVSQIYTIRNTLELLTLPMTVENVTEQDIAELREKLDEIDQCLANNNIIGMAALSRVFHNRIIRISGKNRILRVIETQDEYITRFSALAIKQENRRAAAQAEHHRIVDMLEARDLKGLESIMSEHIEHSKQYCVQALELEQKKA